MPYKLVNCESKHICAFTSAIRDLESQVAYLKDQLKQSRYWSKKEAAESLRLCDLLKFEDELISKLNEENAKLREENSKLRESGRGDF